MSSTIDTARSRAFAIYQQYLDAWSKTDGPTSATAIDDFKRDLSLPADYGSVSESADAWTLHKFTKASPAGMFYLKNVGIHMGHRPDLNTFVIRQIEYPKQAFTAEQVQGFAVQSLLCPHCTIGDIVAAPAESMLSVVESPRQTTVKRIKEGVTRMKVGAAVGAGALAADEFFPEFAFGLKLAAAGISALWEIYADHPLDYTSHLLATAIDSPGWTDRLSQFLKKQEKSDGSGAA